MGRFSGVLLASDFDNTMIYTEESLRAGVPVPKLAEANRQALEYFMGEGGRFSVATGRALAAFSRYVGDLPMNAPTVICNGAALYDFEAEHYLELTMLDEHARLRAQQVLDRFPAVAAEAYHIDNRIYAVHPNEVTRCHEHVTKVSLMESPSLMDVPLPLGKLLFEGDRESLETVRTYLLDQGWGQDYELIFSGKSLLEMTARGANKGGMVRRLAKHLGISMDHVYCIGDESNDLPMLEIAAQGFAPENCAEVVRQSGVTIVPHARDNALAAVVEHLKARYPEKQ